MVLEFASQLARQAGAELLRRFDPAGTPATRKTDKTLVTLADYAADSLLRSAIQAAYPEDGLISEEAQTSLTYLPAAAWVIDPLDGTTNFSLGLHVWGVSIARLENGYPAAAAVYFPLLNELYTSQRDGGAFLNGKPIRVKPRHPAQTLPFFACCSRTHLRYQVSIPYKVRILGCASYSFCLAARGAALVAFEVTPKLWDIAAAWLILSEAGGSIQALSEAQPFPLTAGLDYSSLSFPTLAAASSDELNTARGNLRLKE